MWTSYALENYYDILVLRDGPYLVLEKGIMIH